MIVDKFEAHHEGCLVYHMIHNVYEFGECYSILYVSPDTDEWQRDKDDIKEGYVFAASPSDKNELLSDNGSMEHPYIIPEKLFWDCDGQTSPTPYVNPYITDLLNWTFIPNYTPINATAKISWDEQLSAQLTGTGIVLSESGVKEGTMSLAIDSQAPSVEQLKTGFDFSCKIKYVDEISTRENEESIYFKISPVGYSWRNN